MKKIRSLKVIVYHSLLDSIIRGEYHPNQLITEAEIIQKYGCSKSPVREAMVALCEEGVLQSVPRRGYMIQFMDSDTIQQIKQFRFTLEASFLRNHYKGITNEQINELYELDSLCNSPCDSFWQHWEYNKQFHLKLFSYYENEYAYQQLERTLDFLKRAYSQNNWDCWDKPYPGATTNFHPGILEGIQNRDFELTLHYLEMDLAQLQVI